MIDSPSFCCVPFFRSETKVQPTCKERWLIIQDVKTSEDHWGHCRVCLLYVCVCACVYMYMNTYMHAHVFMCVCTHIYTNVYIPTHLYIERNYAWNAWLLHYMCEKIQHSFFFFFLKIYLWIDWLIAMLGLRFCARAFSSCGKRGPLFIAVRGPLTITASLVGEHRLQTRRLSSCGSRA